MPKPNNLKRAAVCGVTGLITAAKPKPVNATKPKVKQKPAQSRRAPAKRPVIVLAASPDSKLSAKEAKADVDKARKELDEAKQKNAHGKQPTIKTLPSKEVGDETGKKLREHHKTQLKIVGQALS